MTRTSSTQQRDFAEFQAARARWQQRRRRRAAARRSRSCSRAIPTIATPGCWLAEVCCCRRATTGGLRARPKRRSTPIPTTPQRAVHRWAWCSTRSGRAADALALLRAGDANWSRTTKLYAVGYRTADQAARETIRRPNGTALESPRRRRLAHRRLTATAYDPSAHAGQRRSRRFAIATPIGSRAAGRFCRRSMPTGRPRPEHSMAATAGRPWRSGDGWKTALELLSAKRPPQARQPANPDLRGGRGPTTQPSGPGGRAACAGCAAVSAARRRSIAFSGAAYYRLGRLPIVPSCTPASTFVGQVECAVLLFNGVHVGETRSARVGRSPLPAGPDARPEIRPPAR